ncbi:hypothetical protein RHMOL_Rhmol10G0152000 [Rhododendron molle]|uniref:Uncharacterized protein n=1 Tax=Rhododendron molle TaxID=49168 RepID=A0ACC0M2E7_RHOML|nr:hypothetical protein RHMOL_Rhmol10G0152000 [Rhododendron molle]
MTSPPQRRGMKEHSLMSRNMGIYSSPGTPDYHDGNVGSIRKGWNSERVPLPSNSSRRHINAAALMPFNSGRTLPSKWDDAERWITSPVSGLGVSRPLPQQPQRRPKSKSGPIGGPGVDSFSNYSPAPQLLQGGSVRDFMAGSPFTTGVLVPDGMSIQYGGHNVVQSSLVHTGTAMGRTASLLGWSDTLTESSSPSSRVREWGKRKDEVEIVKIIVDHQMAGVSTYEKLVGTKDAETTVSRVVSRRDMATQMSPTDSTRSSATSPKDRLSFSTSPPSILPVLEPYSNHSAKLEIRDVQVDKRVTVTRQSGKHGVRMKQNESPVVEDLTSTWDISKATRNISKLQKEEAKIAAWENLQKAKAEAAVRKLEDQVGVVGVAKFSYRSAVNWVDDHLHIFWGIEGLVLMFAGDNTILRCNVNLKVAGLPHPISVEARITPTPK